MAIERITPAEALARQSAGARLVDVREPHERAVAMAANAQGLSTAEIERDPDAAFPDRAEPLMLICERGGRSANVAEQLDAMGYTRVASVEGGTARWIADDLPLAPRNADGDFYERYSRHLRLPDVGEAGQRRLQAARVVLIGAGGLGSPVAYYLAAAGVGHIRVIDDDRVDRSNLQRQILHTDAAVGTPKVESAKRALLSLNPTLHVDAVDARVVGDNVEALLADADVVIDGADNFPVRYLLNAACVRLGKPLVYGAVHRFEGQLAVFDAGRQRGRAPCYRCLFPEAPPAEAAPNCAEAGVLGVLPGVIGLLQATEALKLLLGIGEPLIGRLLHFDALGLRFRETRLSPDPACATCGLDAVFSGYEDMAKACSAT